jgi:molecular chaperone IbpA
MNQQLANLFSKLPMIGFDDLVSKTVEKFPFWNGYHNKDTDSYVLELAVAGFDKQDITVTCDNGILTVNGNKTVPDYVENMVNFYRGIALRSFSREFMIGKLWEVTKVQMKNGMLTIHVTKSDVSRTNSIPIED